MIHKTPTAKAQKIVQPYLLEQKLRRTTAELTPLFLHGGSNKQLWDLHAVYSGKHFGSSVKTRSQIIINVAFTLDNGLCGIYKGNFKVNYGERCYNKNYIEAFALCTNNFINFYCVWFFIFVVHKNTHQRQSNAHLQQFIWTNP